MSKKQVKPTNKRKTNKTATRKTPAVAANTNFRLFRAILLCAEVLTVGWIALVANNIFKQEFEITAPYYVIMAVVFFITLLVMTFFTKERDMLILVTVFYVAAAIGVTFVPSYAILGTVRCEADMANCTEQTIVYEQRNLYWMKVR